jgi:catechol 2,3-dioxygenase-like lactoylglutathione lyase family enzyme
MSNPHFVILYVENPTASAAFYRKLLEREPIDASPTFVMLALRDGLMLGLWARSGVRPPDSASPGGGDLCFPAKDSAAVDAAHARWKSLGVSILQAPIDMDFGRTFVALDPDGHRLRVFSPAEA